MPYYKTDNVNNQPLVSIITVNFRDAAVTCDLLDSIRSNSYKKLEVVLIDNGSLEDKTAEFKAHFPEVMVIISKNNLGFAGGNNLGISRAKGEYLFFVNNDTIFTDGLIENLLKRFETPNVGAVGPKIHYFDLPGIIQFAGFTTVNPITGRNQTIGENEMDCGLYDEAKEVPYIHGAAMMVSREVINQVGGMPTEYFLYYEELDWCEQIRRAEYRIFYEPAALIYHKESMAVQKLSHLKIYYLTRNRILFMRRNATPLHFLAFTFFFSTITFPRWILQYTLKGSFGELKAFVKAVLWNLGFKKLNPFILQIF